MSQTSQNLVGKRVREAREKSQPPLTQEQLSQKLAKSHVSIDRAGIAKIETGIRGVLDYEVVALAKALGVKVTWLLGVQE
jgi:HTH-type transcriptional regulator, cell division transcriptional repressor